MDTKRTSFSGLKKGQKFIVIGNTCGHNYPMNGILTLNRDFSKISNGSSANDVASECHGNALNFCDIELIGDTISVKEMADTITKLDAEKAEFIRKIKVCEEFGVDTYDDQVFKVYEALKSVAGVKNNKEKAVLLKEALFGGNGI